VGRYTWKGIKYLNKLNHALRLELGTLYCDACHTGVTSGALAQHLHGKFHIEKLGLYNAQGSVDQTLIQAITAYEESDDTQDQTLAPDVKIFRAEVCLMACDSTTSINAVNKMKPFLERYTNKQVGSVTELGNYIPPNLATEYDRMEHIWGVKCFPEYGACGSSVFCVFFRRIA